MRIRHAVVFVAFALAAASANSDESLVALAIEPEVDVSAPTLESAARANDFPTFDALYRAEPDPAFRALHELWTYSMTDPVGAFYGAEMYQRFSREDPAYAEFIEPYRIVDSNGNAFYPSSETRAFLLDHRAAAPRVVPRIAQSAAERAAERRLPAGRSAGILPADLARPVPAGSRRSGRQDAGAPQKTDAPQKTVAPPEAVAPREAVVRREASAPNQPVAPAPAEALELPTSIVSERAPAPAEIVAAPEPAPTAAGSATAPVPAAVPPRATNRGLLLVIIGLIGVGLLALIVRTPREVIP